MIRDRGLGGIGISSAVSHLRDEIALALVRDLARLKILQQLRNQVHLSADKFGQ